MDKEKKKKEVTPKTSTVLKYTGNVTISVLRKNKIVKQYKNHNEGNSNLFTFILNCLAGEYYDVDRPRWIVAYYTENNQDYYSIPSYIPINEVGVKTNNETTPVLSYRCLISSSYLGSNGKDINGLLFYSDNGRNMNNIEGMAGQAVKDTHYSMRMDFGNVEETHFVDQDLLIEWQVRIVSAVQNV